MTAQLPGDHYMSTFPRVHDRFHALRIVRVPGHFEAARLSSDLHLSLRHFIPFCRRQSPSRASILDRVSVSRHIWSPLMLVADEHRCSGRDLCDRRLRTVCTECRRSSARVCADGD